jgi:hypothetical protein
LIEIILPRSEDHNVRELIQNRSVVGFWQEESSDTAYLVKVLLSAGKTEAFLDELERKFGHKEGFRVIMLPVEATIPRYEDEAAPDPGNARSLPCRVRVMAARNGRRPVSVGRSCTRRSRMV